MGHTVTFTTPSNCVYVNKVKFKWTDVEQKSLGDIKRAVAHDTIPSYPNFNKHFNVHTYASDYQLGAVIILDFKPFALYSRKLIGPQTKYTLRERGLLSIVKRLNEFCTLLLGQQFKYSLAIKSNM